MINWTTAFQSKQATISNTAVLLTSVLIGFTAAEVLRASRLIICVNTNSVNINWSGVNDPTTTAGRTIAAGVSVEIVGNENISQLKIIRSGASDASVFFMLEA